MRIIGGRLKRRTIPSASLVGARPTTDRSRETMFNILANYVDFEGMRVLDIFAGSGALGFEAMSRGASRTVFVEKNRRNARQVQDSAASLGLGESIRVVQADAAVALRSLAEDANEGAFDLVFADPPYAARLISPVLAALDRLTLVIPGGMFVAEHAPHESVTIPPGWQLLTERRMGETQIEFFERSEESVV